ncbi:MAG TPA: hypothetical protein VJ779_20575 [Acetobacteraceae bacterium]|nr:hypothetical protein [Acetobacteraceae bacterium]
MLLPNTPETRTLWKAVNSRIGAESRWLRAQTAQEVLIGLGALLLMLGIGVGTGLFGYSFLLDRRPRMDEMAAAFATALAHTPLKLDTQGASVRLDASGVPRPSSAQLGTGVAPQSSVPVVTNFTVFKHVQYGHGTVVTGWTYASSESPTPASQFCYYSEPSGGGAATLYDIARNGQLLTVDHAPVDVAEAARDCVWSDGRPTGSAS